MQWTRHQKGGFKRDYHAAVAVGHKVYSFGGREETLSQIDVHVYNTVSSLWVKLPPLVTAGEEDNGALEVVPLMLYGHTAVLIEDTIYIWGGRTYTGKYNNDYRNELYAFDVNTHTWFKPKTSGHVPAVRWLHSACVLGKDMYIYGGSGAPAHSYNDMHKLDTTTMVWSLINVQGTPASNHTATIIGTRIFVFGGYGGYGFDYLGNCSVFDTETNCWLPTPAQLPERRCGHSAFAYNGELYIFGGHNYFRARHFDDFWKYNPETCSWTQVELEPNGESPWAKGYSSIPMSRMCCCMVGEHIIFFGGHRPDDLYILDLSLFHNVGLCYMRTNY